jgi:peptidylprolyl isomerase
MKKSEKAKGKERTESKKKQTTLYVIAGVAVCIIVAVILFFTLNPAVVKSGDMVSVLYIGTLENGSVFDSNVNKTPLTFTVGAHTVIPGFEDAVIGMSKDQVKTVHIPFDKAYGSYRDDLVSTVNRSLFPADSPPQAGMYYTVTNPADGSAHILRILSFTKDTVTIDGNHMLAGQNLTFMIRVVGITPAK